MNQPNLSRQQWLDLARLLHDTSVKLPKTGNYAPSYEANRCDLDELYRAFRADATQSRSEVLRLVEEWETQGAWPKGKYKAKFWLRARVEEARAFVQEIVALPSSSAIRADGRGQSSHGNILHKITTKCYHASGNRPPGRIKAESNLHCVRPSGLRILISARGV